MIRKRTTRELLSESLHDLAKIKSIDKITVKEIAENCGVSKATFYNYFQDKYDLINWIYNYQLHNVLDEYAKKNISWKNVLNQLINILNNDKTYFRNALKNTFGPNSFYISASQETMDWLINLLKERYPEQLDDEIVFDIKCYISGLSFIVTRWYLNQSNYSVKELVQYATNAIPEKLKMYLK
ncbi:TetR family transcriptional regulator [Lactobacillus ultunensis]|uniref:Transcriptional regulator, TetR family n=1 Tax=Lactobacillus ultunensis DSM 16047 TaxID=525365 RepID=C2ER46_9LACO|nr:TetR family transcriptional regulator [Lactobacillus ultunensis]EEJ71031.1 transcriptional regulator, TetR family [Lactobacillus ultunensis DSM 16047]KRL81065.1 transcriptional regulator [Lactobacillus ultunensis DSM 16047]QQP28963.1 TetR family transcriptional regulator [Lactobacillus ultunensis]